MTPDTARALRELTRQAACLHTNREGGNEYHRCHDCGLFWDYRRETADSALRDKAQTLDALLSADAPLVPCLVDGGAAGEPDVAGLVERLKARLAEGHFDGVTNRGLVREAIVALSRSASPQEPQP